jgi:thiol:disulfide interchange protein
LAESTEESEGVEPAQTGGQYIDYSEAAIAENADKDIVIFFHAQWCPNCRELEKTLTAGAIPENIVIMKADYDTETELKKKYGVTQQTTMVQVNGQGEKQTIWVANAFDDIEAIKEQLI